MDNFLSKRSSVEYISRRSPKLGLDGPKLGMMDFNSEVGILKVDAFIGMSKMTLYDVSRLSVTASR